jgi:hypothetical protein
VSLQANVVLDIIEGWVKPRARPTLPLMRSDERGLARNGDGGRREWRAELERLGGQVELRVEGLVPGQSLASIGRHPTHDRRQGALGDGLQLVERLARADAIDQVDVFLFVGVPLVDVLGSSPDGLAISGLVDVGLVGQLVDPLGADDGLRVRAGAAVDLAALAAGLDPVGIFVLDREMIEDIAIDRRSADLSTQAIG